MANRKTQKKREREAAKKLKPKSYFDYAFGVETIKMEGDDSFGDGDTQHRVSGGASIPSGESSGVD